MGISPTNTDENVMSTVASDAAMAREYIERIGEPGKVKTILGSAHDWLTRCFPGSTFWTPRKLRAIWNDETSTVGFSHMVELHVALQRKEAERERLAQARTEHADFIAHTARLEALLVAQDADFHRDQIEGLRRQRCGMGGARDQGTERKG